MTEKLVSYRGAYNLRPDLEILEQSGSGRGVKFYAPLLVWTNFISKITLHTYVGLCNKQITHTNKYLPGLMAPKLSEFI